MYIILKYIYMYISIQKNHIIQIRNSSKNIDIQLTFLTINNYY